MKSPSKLLAVVVAAVGLMVAPSARAQAAPDFDLAPLSGPPLRIGDFAGRPLVVDFWASWCEACKAAVDEHRQLMARHGPALGFVAISLDESADAARAFLGKHPLPTSVLHDPRGTVAEAYGVSELPYTVVVDARGNIAERIGGAPYPRLWAAVDRVAVPAQGATGGCAGLVDRSGAAMGSRLTIRLCPGTANASAVARALDEAFKRIAGLEAKWSTWIPGSELARLNRTPAGMPVEISDETYALLQRSLAGSLSTGGLFDITFAPLAALWRFDTPPESRARSGDHAPGHLVELPTVEAVEALRGRIGYAGLKLSSTGTEPRTATLTREGMAVHVGGIGKGAAVDAIVADFRRQGFTDFCVQAGGDLFCAGHNGPRPWRVGIAHPRQRGALIGTLEVTDAAFSTSGDYERFAVIDGRRYHHIIDPRSGFPATASQSATVLARSATDAEVLTKAAFILGGEAGLALLAASGSSGVIVDAAGHLHVSPGLKLEMP